MRPAHSCPDTAPSGAGKGSALVVPGLPRAALTGVLPLLVLAAGARTHHRMARHTVVP